VKDDLFALRVVGWCGVVGGAALMVFWKPIGRWLLHVTGPHIFRDYMWPVRYMARVALLGMSVVVASLFILWLRRRLTRDGGS
jgi:hypothetical protein